MTQSLVHHRSNRTPCWVGAYAETVIGARGDPTRLTRVFARSVVPMLMVDHQRRYLDANIPARLALRQSLAELRRLRIDDLTPEYFLPVMKAAWARLTETGCMAGPHEIGSPVGTHLHVTYYALADALPGVHLIAFAPAEWPERELVGDLPRVAPFPTLTPRELEVLSLAADGSSGPEIAAQLVVSPTTVRTHFQHIYTKLDVGDRAAAVAKAMRLGLIV
jgi:DNA-binding CsgD family transcriptional regulator